MCRMQSYNQINFTILRFFIQQKKVSRVKITRFRTESVNDETITSIESKAQRYSTRFTYKPSTSTNMLWLQTARILKPGFSSSKERKERLKKNETSCMTKRTECAAFIHQQSLNHLLGLRSHNQILTNRIFIASCWGANIDPLADGYPSPSLFVFNISQGCEREQIYPWLWYLKWSDELQVHFHAIIKWRERERKATNHILKTTTQRSQQNSFRERTGWRKDGENIKRDVLFHYTIGL